jgi:hypothetical protein
MLGGGECSQMTGDFMLYNDRFQQTDLNILVSYKK